MGRSRSLPGVGPRLRLEPLESRVTPAALFGGLGPSEFRVSEAGGDALEPAVAYNPRADQYLIVWSADGNPTPGKFEVFGQIVRADGSVVVDDFAVSETGPAGDPAFDAFDPAVVYNPQLDQYLIVWDGTNRVIAGDPEQEIYGQIVASNGSTVKNDFRISDAGGDNIVPEDLALRDAVNPAVGYDSVRNRYLVVWEADDTDTPGVANEEFEIFGQVLSPAGEPVGANDFRISDAGADGDPDSDARNPAVAFNPAGNEFLVVWQANEQPTTDGDPQFEVYGQRLALDPSCARRSARAACSPCGWAGCGTPPPAAPRCRPGWAGCGCWTAGSWPPRTAVTWPCTRGR